jgi:energy-coupling factor transporter transmembrane protein EcfT
VVLIAVGALWLLDAAGAVDAGAVIHDWWPLALVALAVIAVVIDERLSLGPVALCVIGALLLVGQLGAVDVGKVVWPTIAVVAGLWLLVQLTPWSARREPDTDREDVIAVFGASRGRNRSPHFRHANVSGIFGGATLDLSHAHPDPGARVDAFALFGGADVLVPPGWRISLGGLPLFGGYEDRTKGDGELPLDAPELKVSATAIFGGVTVKTPQPV